MKSEPTTGELIIPDESGPLAEFAHEAPTIDNFKGDPLQQWQLAAACAGASCRDGRELLGQSFPLTYWQVSSVEIMRDDGELIPAKRVVLLDSQGNAYGFTSDGVYGTLRLLVHKLGPGPYDPPILITVRERQTRSKRTVFLIEPAVVKPSTAAQKGKGTT